MRIATRGSELALWQANTVAGLLTEAGINNTEIVVVSTSGDRDKSTPLHQIGGKGVFVKEVQHAVLDGRADIAVHSAKDMPAISPDELMLGAVPERGNPHDALVGSRLADLAPGATVATGSIRRRAQLVAVRPDLVFSELRGNIDSRLAKASDFDAIVMAAAAIERLDVVPTVVAAEFVDIIDTTVMVPQVGQGCLAIECKTTDDAAAAALAAIEHGPSRRCFDAERAFLRELGGDCSLPAGAHAVLTGEADRDRDSDVAIVGFLASDDASQSAQLELAGAAGPALGIELARRLRAQIGA